jgi:putative aldouronate transport system substrate-binding protein
MYRKWKSILSLVLAILMIMVLLAACSGTQDDTATDQQSGQGQQGQGEQASEGEQGEYVKNETTEKMVIFMPFANESTPEGIEKVKKALEDAMKDTVNVTLDWVIIPRENFEEKLNTLLVGGEQLDGGVGDLDDLASMSMKPGLVMPLNDLLDQYGKHLKELIPKEAWDAVTNSKGEIMGIPAYARYYWQGAVIRQDWLDKLGLKMPETLDELEAVMEAFKKMDSKIVPASGQSWYMEPVLMSAVTGDVSPNFEWDTLDESEENVINSFTHPKYQEFLKLYNKWIDKGWWNKDFLVTDDTQNDQLFCSGKIGILFTDPHNADRYERILKQTDPNAKVNFLHVPSGPAGGPAFPMNNGVGRIVWINQNTKHPERVVQYFDWLVGDKEHYTLAKLGIEGENWVKDGEMWKLPEAAGGDPTKRGYFDIFAPLDYEALIPLRSDEPPINKEIDDYYKSLPVITPKLYGFHPDLSKVMEMTATDPAPDIWADMYNIAAKARPLSDWEKVCDDFYNSRGAKIMYDELTKQYQEWKAK